MNFSKSSNGSPMTELQLRLWCLWMCDAFSGLSGEECFQAACQRADKGMRRHMEAIEDRAFAELTTESACKISNVSRRAWELSERMP